MATTSGTATYQPNRNQIILRAGRQVGAWASGETPSAQEVQDWSDALNAIVKAWDATGLHLWTENEGVLFPTPGQNRYQLGPTSTDKACNAVGMQQTSLSTAGAAGSTSLSVSSIAGFANGQAIGVYLDSGSYFWTTVNGTPSGSTIVIASGLPSQASASNPVYTYTSAMLRPLRVLAVRRYNSASQIDTPINLISRLDFEDLPNKLNTGLVNQCFYDPQLGNGVFWLWQAPTDASYVVKFTFMRELQDFNTASDMPDFPKEWTNALVWNLANEMTTEYGTPDPRASRIKDMAGYWLDVASGFDREPESIFVGVNHDTSSR